MTKKLPQISLPIWNGVYYTSPPQKRDHTKGYEEASETSRLNNIHFVICLHKMGQRPQSDLDLVPSIGWPERTLDW